MRWPVALPVLALMTLPLFGCGQTSSPPPVPSPPAVDPQAKQVSDAAEIIKGINEAVKSSGPLAAGVSFGVTQVGSHRVKTTMDVPASTVVQDEKAVVDFGGRKLTIEFDKGQVLLGDTEKATLPAGTKEVDVHFVGGKLTVTADGAPVSIPSTPK
jgi:hypothetical protein